MKEVTFEAKNIIKEREDERKEVRGNRRRQIGVRNIIEGTGGEFI